MSDMKTPSSAAPSPYKSKAFREYLLQNGAKRKERLAEKSFLKEREEELETHLAQIEDLRAKIGGLENELEKANHQKEKMAHNLEETESEMQGANEKVRSLREEVSVLSAQLAGEKVKGENLTETIQSLREECHSLRSEKRDVFGKEKALQTAFDNASAELQLLKTELKKCKEECQELRTEAGDWRQSSENNNRALQVAQNEVYAAREELQKVKESAQEVGHASRGELQQCQAARLQAEEEVARLRRKVEDGSKAMQAVKGELESAFMKMDKLSEERDQLRESNVDLLGRLGEKESALEELASETEELMHRSQRVEVQLAVEKERDGSMRSSNRAALESLKQEVRDLRHQLESADQKHAADQEEWNSIRFQIEEAWEKDRIELKSARDTLQEESLNRSSVEQREEVQNVVLEKWVNKVNDLQKQAEADGDTIDQLKRVISRYEAELSKMREVEDTCSYVVAENQRLSGLETTLLELQDQVMELQSDLADEKTRNDVVEAELQEERIQRTVAEKLLQKEREGCAALQASCSSQEKALNDLRVQLQLLQEDHATATSWIEDERERSRELQAALDDSRHRLIEEQIRQSASESSFSRERQAYQVALAHSSPLAAPSPRMMVPLEQESMMDRSNEPAALPLSESGPIETGSNTTTTDEDEPLPTHSHENENVNVNVNDHPRGNHDQERTRLMRLVVQEQERRVSMLGAAIAGKEESLGGANAVGKLDPSLSKLQSKVQEVKGKHQPQESSLDFLYLLMKVQENYYFALDAQAKKVREKKEKEDKKNASLNASNEKGQGKNEEKEKEKETTKGPEIREKYHHKISHLYQKNPSVADGATLQWSASLRS
jgi:chromosome segregation ATPase